MLYKPPLYKGRWLAVRQDGGIVRLSICKSFKMIVLQSLSHSFAVTAPFAGGSLRELGAYAGAT